MLKKLMITTVIWPCSAPRKPYFNMNLTNAYDRYLEHADSSALNQKYTGWHIEPHNIKVYIFVEKQTIN